MKDGTKYITHHKFEGKPIYGSDKEITLYVATPLVCVKDCLMTTNYQLVVCTVHSENGKRCFARNDDDQGLKRGQLTFAIAYAERKLEGTGFRFTEEEQKMLCEEYDYWLRPDAWTILFNDDFFAADIADLQELAQRLNIKV